ncbi:MAG: HAMP domain-containing histidine kinase [Tissierellia bacterium]|nr:HAMP domain-containing histidine kinase [Tissierellia bacterium]
MKLSNKILYYFTISIFIVIILSVLITSIAFRATIDSYLEAQVDEQFRKLANDISTIYSIGPALDSRSLAVYSENQNINIKVYDNTDSLIAEFYGLRDKGIEQKRLVSKEFALVNAAGVKIGNIQISYFENLYLYNQSINNFYVSMARSYAIIIIISLIMGFLIVMYFSKRIVSPISEMNEFTKKLKSGDYNLSIKKYDTYELDELSRNLNYLSNTLSLQENYRVSYAQDIAHELRTPLTNLLLHLEGIRDEIIEADPQVINLLINEVNRLNSMVNNLQISFNDGDKKLELDMTSVDVSDLINQTIASFKLKLEDKNINLTLNFPEDFNIVLDKDKFIQVINNLISNAIKAVDENGEITITGTKFKNRSVINIKDNGVGIPKENIKQIFDRFYRVNNDRNRKTGGHGLGLTITKTFVELMGGNIKVNSVLGKGSEFILTFSDQKK